MKQERGKRGALDPDGCEALAAAIILRAARDYVNALRRLQKNKNNALAQAQVKELRRFFRSQYFGILCDLDGDHVLDRIELEFEETNGKYNVGWIFTPAIGAKNKDL